MQQHGEALRSAHQTHLLHPLNFNVILTHPPHALSLFFFRNLKFITHMAMQHILNSGLLRKGMSSVLASSGKVRNSLFNSVRAISMTPSFQELQEGRFVCVRLHEMSKERCTNHRLQNLCHITCLFCTHIHINTHTHTHTHTHTWWQGVRVCVWCVCVVCVCVCVCGVCVCV